MVANRIRPVFTLAAAALVAALVIVIGGPAARAAGLPTGEVLMGQSVIEPAYNDADGSLIYLLTPSEPPAHPNGHTTAPLYLIMYPTSVAGSVGTMNCQHQPLDNCPDHGPFVTGLAQQAEPLVYPQGGVWGHDHLVAGPASGGDFNILWEPIIVLFKVGTPITHITTLAQLQPLMDSNLVDVIPLPAATFHCSVVPAATYNNGTPLPPAPPLP